MLSGILRGSKSSNGGTVRHEVRHEGFPREKGPASEILDRVKTALVIYGIAKKEALGEVFTRAFANTWIECSQKKRRRSSRRYPYFDFFLGILAPELRASLSAIATACLRLFTFFPLPDLRPPCLYSLITL